MPQTKPKYQIPLMKEVKNVKSNGLNVISTFSGCGGSSLGYKMAGFNVLASVEFIETARDTYAANFPNTFIDPRDVRKIKGKELIRSAGLLEGELDVLDGSPPCSSFSNAGLRTAGWGEVKKYSETKQRTDDLFFEYIRLVEEMKPKVFVAENVPGLVTGKSKGMFVIIMQRLKRLGYNVRVKILDAQWLGVPQRRKRLIFLGVKDNLGVSIDFPTPNSYYYTVKDAIGNINPDVEPETCIAKFAIGKEWDRMGKSGTQSEKYFSLIRPDWDKPCPVITATTSNVGAAGVCHPSEKRKLSIAELKRICSFPNDFILKGKYHQRAERLGRAVPPLMMKSMASQIREKLQ